MEAETTLGELADRYLERRVRPKKRPLTVAREERLIESELRPVWGTKSASEITRKDVAALLDSMVEAGSGLASERTRAILGRIFEFGVAEGLLDENPLSFNARVPRAWSFPLVALGALMLMGIAETGVTSADVNAFKFGAVMPLWASWRVWTKKGKYGLLSRSDLFVAEGRQIGRRHFVAWGVVSALFLVMLFAALARAVAG